jgi:hypothetical protein
MAKTKQQIQEEANRLFGKGASDEKFKWRQEQQRAAGLDVEKKTRGGVAGAYDRNKGLVQAAVPTLAGMFIPGSAPLIGAISGGLARGLDRPGKGGVGLDLGQAAQGAATGAALGSLGRYAGGKMGVGPGAAPVPTGGNVPGPKPGQTVTTPNYGQPIGTSPAPTPTPTPTSTDKTTMQRLLGVAKENAPLIQGVTGGVSTVIGAKLEADAANRRYDLDEEMFREEQARKDRLAKLLMPMFQQQVQQYGAQRQG